MGCWSGYAGAGDLGFDCCRGRAERGGRWSPRESMLVVEMDVVRVGRECYVVKAWKLGAKSRERRGRRGREEEIRKGRNEANGGPRL